MKRLPLLMVGIAVLAAFAFPEKSIRYTLSDASRIWIDGTSSVHNWTCETTNVSGILEIRDELAQVTKAAVTVPSGSIDCKNGAMSKKAAAALSAKKHPAIRFTLESASVNSTNEGARIEASGGLELAGKAKKVHVSVLGQPQSDGTYRFTGSFPLAMSDFGIDPPTAMLGTLKTGDKVVLRFDLVALPAPISSVINAQSANGS